MKNKITLFFSFLTLTLFASAQLDTLLIDKTEKTISVPNVLQINKCVKWHVDFDRLKKTVIYSDKIISMGLYGGFVCLDYKSLTLDESFTNQLNTDFFTNIACFNDTLFAEKFDEIFYWSENDIIWKKYNFLLPVKFFDIIYQDKDYIFYPVDFGEWGARLFIYDKRKKVTKALNTGNCANAIIKIDGNYLISGSTRHMFGFSNLFSLQDIDAMPVLVDHSKKKSTTSVQEYWKMNVSLEESNKPVGYKEEQPPLMGTVLSSTFLFQNTIYHFMEAKSSNGKMTLLKNQQGKLVQQDSLASFKIDFTNSYNGDCVFNAGIYDQGFILLQKNRLIRIKYEPQVPYTFEDRMVNNSGNIEFVPYFTLYEKLIDRDSIVKEKIVRENNMIVSRKTTYRINDKDYIHTAHYQDNKIFINYQGEEKRLKFDNSENVLRYCIKNGGTDFLYFFCLGNINHKYGLIEVTDWKKFFEDYSR